MPMDLWKAAVLDSGGYFGVSGEQVDAVAREIEKIEYDEIGTDDFVAACGAPCSARTRGFALLGFSGRVSFVL